MPYSFNGFFCFTGDTKTLARIGEAVQQQWPVAALRHIFEPARGIGAGLPTGDYRPPAEALRIKAALPGFSRLFPEQEFFYLESYHWGGPGINTGFIVRNGAIRFEITDAPEDDSGFAALVAALPLQLDGLYFEPLTRYYFSSGGYLSAEVHYPSEEEIIGLLRESGCPIEMTSPGWYELKYGNETFRFSAWNDNNSVRIHGHFPACNEVLIDSISRWAEPLQRCSFTLDLFDTVNGQGQHWENGDDEGKLGR